jgi:hypothetical protein
VTLWPLTVAEVSAIVGPGTPGWGGMAGTTYDVLRAMPSLILFVGPVTRDISQFQVLRRCTYAGRCCHATLSGHNWQARANLGRAVE